MTIIRDFGAWHIESHTVTISLPDAAGITDSASITLDRPGTLLSHSTTFDFTFSNDNTQAVGTMFPLYNGAGTQFSFGLRVQSFIVRVIKAAGTAGASNAAITITLFIHDKRS